MGEGHSLTVKWSIVLGSNPSILEETAATGLRTALAKRQRLNVRILSEPAGGYRQAIVLGTPDSSSLIQGYVTSGVVRACGAEAYHIKTHEGNLLIAGYDPRGVLYGAYRLEHLIEEFHGIPAGRLDEARQPVFRTRIGWMGGRWLRAGQRREGHTDEAYDYLARCGFNAILLMNYAPNRMDALSDPTFCAYSKVFPDIVPRGMIETNRAEVRRRIEMATKHGLDTYLHMCGPLGVSLDKMPEPERQCMKLFAEKHPECFETRSEFCRYGRDSRGEPFPCLSMRNGRVLDHYRDVTREMFESFPELKGLRFWAWDCPPGDSFLREYPSFVNLIYGSAKESNPRIAAFWWDWGVFDETKYEHIIRHLDPGIGFISCTDEPFLALHDAERGRSLSLSRIRRAKGVGPRREIAANDMLIQAEDLGLVSFVPHPIAVYEKLKTFASLRVLNVQDYHGTIGPEYFRMRGFEATGINEQVFWECIWDPYQEEERVLRRVARRSFGREAAGDALGAWRMVDKALSHWKVLRWDQKLHAAALGIESWWVGWLYRPITLDSLRKTSEEQRQLCESTDTLFHAGVRREVMRKPTIWQELSRINRTVAKELVEAITHADRAANLADSDKKSFAEFQSGVIRFVRRQFLSCHHYSEAERVYQLWAREADEQERAKHYAGIRRLAALEIANREATVELIASLKLDPAPGRPAQYVIRLGETRSSISKMKEFLKVPPRSLSCSGS